MRLEATIKRRPECMLVLQSLADRCADDGAGARPTVKTIALESAIGTRTADACLLALRDARVISVEAEASQHRAKTYRINLDQVALRVDGYGFSQLSAEDQSFVLRHKPQATGGAADPQDLAGQNGAPDTQDGAGLNSSDSQDLAGLNTEDSANNVDSDPHDLAALKYPAPQNQQPGPQILQPDPQDRADDPVLDPVDPKDRTAPQTARHTDKAKEPNGDNHAVIRKLAFDLTESHPDYRLPANFGTLVDALKQRCADLRIDYGRADTVPFNATHRAAAWAQLQWLKVKPIEQARAAS